VSSGTPTPGGVLAEARFEEVDAAFLLDVRGWLSQPPRDWAPRFVRDVAVVLGELMTNAFRHADRPFAARLTMAGPGDAVRVEVHGGARTPGVGW
jgi:hypothetical protein